MEYKLGNGKKIKEACETCELTCPKCNKKTVMSMYSNGNTDIVSSFPFVESSTVYFLVCPECASVYGVDEEKGKMLKKGEALAVGNFDLKELKEF